MSWTPSPDPTEDHPAAPDVETVIIPRSHDVGGFDVWRALPSRQKRMVGPFIFWDQMGPGEFITGTGIDVRPHPHIGLSTLTYLFDGSIMHRDSLGVQQEVFPGDVNLMTAGQGIVHSERTSDTVRAHPHTLYGIQSWLALPKTHEDGAPAFDHIKESDLPRLSDTGADIHLIAGSLHGKTSPLKFPHDALYADIKLKAGQTFSIPRDAEERAIYPLTGRVIVGDTAYDPMQLLVLTPGRAVTIKAESDTHFMLLGGAVMDAPRYIWWNFVSSSKERLEQAKQDWKAGAFPKVPGETEFIPLPE